MLALTSLTRHLLPAMLEQRSGAILNVSSSASFSASRRFCRLCRDQSLRHQFLRRSPRRTTRERCHCYSALPRSSPHRVLSGGAKTEHKEAEGYTWIWSCLGAESRSRRARRDRSGSRHRHPRFHHETGDDHGPHDANATAPRRFAFLRETDVAAIASCI